MQPLEGIRVLDLTRILAGPYCTMMLGDLGADVIKVERPGQGDDSRSWGPPFVGEPCGPYPGEAAYFLAANRNKRSVTLNLKAAEGQEIVRRLASISDVLVENFRGGMLEGLGLGYEDLRTLNPRLVYCSVSGYGRTGPWAERPGYDFIIQAEGGMMGITGPEEGPPYRVGIPIVDIATGMFASTAILAALRARDLTGEGQYVDMSLLDAGGAVDQRRLQLPDRRAGRPPVGQRAPQYHTLRGLPRPGQVVCAGGGQRAAMGHPVRCHRPA